MAAARTTTVAVRPGAALPARRRLFTALEAAFPVTFVDAARSNSPKALLAIRDGDAEPLEAEGTRIPTLLVGDRGRSGPARRPVRFDDCDALDSRIRGLSVTDCPEGSDRAIDSQSQVLAWSGAEPAWTVSPGRAPVHRIRAALPELAPDQPLRDLISRHPLALIPLVQFLRTAAESYSFEPPELRAAILFDDPNLRWRTYGFIDYRQLLAHAEALGYHASMAMIPLDGWGQHRATVELFRKRPDRLSLVLHGNNHLSRELMRPGGDRGALALAAQALRRAESFESRYRLSIDRVMTPPHGMCSESVATALSSLGYHALCAIHPVPWTEQAPADRPLAGWDPAEFAGDCAVIPRVPLGTDLADLAIRAFLDQPLVLYGHHDDLAGGLDPLAETVSSINGLGRVRWSSLGEIAATNHSTRLDQDILRIRPYSHHLRVTVPAGVDKIVVERPRGVGRGLVGWSVNGADQRPFDVPLPCRPGKIALDLTPRARFDPRSVQGPAPTVWPILRRAATEARDRLHPLIRSGAS